MFHPLHCLVVTLRSPRIGQSFHVDHQIQCSTTASMVNRIRAVTMLNGSTAVAGRQARSTPKRHRNHRTDREEQASEARCRASRRTSSTSMYLTLGDGLEKYTPKYGKQENTQKYIRHAGVPCVAWAASGSNVRTVPQRVHS